MIAVLYFRLFTDDVEKDDDDNDKEELNEDHELVKLLAYCCICYYNNCLITLAHRSRKLQVFQPLFEIPPTHPCSYLAE